MKCQNCGAEINENAKFCSKCGVKVEIITNSQNELANEKVCPKCGQRYPSNIKFCMKDGTPLQSEIETKPSMPYKETPDKKAYPQPKAEEVKKATSSKQIIWILLILIIVVSAGIGGYYLYTNIISKKQDIAVTEIQKKQDTVNQTEKPESQKEKTSQEDIKSELPDKVKETEEETKEQKVKTSKSSVTPEKSTTKQSNHLEFTSKIDPFKLEGNINRALRDAGLQNVHAQVNDNLEVTLKGTVSSMSEKERAFAIAKHFKEAKILKDSIFIVE